MVEQPSTHPATIERAPEPRISVIGVGGAGGNAINNMIRANLEGVTFIAANTDAQALGQSLCDRQIQLGAGLTKGLGAGALPDIGQAAAEEAIELIVAALEGANMAFITAGMGGGTGTGGAPVIARAARDEGVLTVGVVSKPFHFEGARRMRQAEAGLIELQKYVDTLIVIPNQNLFRVADAKTTFADAFRLADEVLHAGVRGVTDLMVLPGLVNLDFADVRSIMAGMGKAVMGTGEAEGDNRASAAAEAAISNPLLDDVSLQGARNVLINITGGHDLMLMEVDEAANRIRSEVDADANIIFGSAFSDTLDGKIRVSVIATGGDIEVAQAAQRHTDSPFVGAPAQRQSDHADTRIHAAGSAERAAPRDEPLTLRVRNDSPVDDTDRAAVPEDTPAPPVAAPQTGPETHATAAPASAETPTDDAPAAAPARARTPTDKAPAAAPASVRAANPAVTPVQQAATRANGGGEPAPVASPATAPAARPATLFSNDQPSPSEATEPNAETEQRKPSALPGLSDRAAETLDDPDPIERASAMPPARTEIPTGPLSSSTRSYEAGGTSMLKSRFFRPAKELKSQSPLSSSTQEYEAEGISMLKSRFFRPAKPAKSRTTLEAFKEGNGVLDVSDEHLETTDADDGKMHFVVWQVDSGARIFKVPEGKLALIEEQPDVERLKLFDDLEQAKVEASAIFKRIAADRAAKGLTTSTLEPTLRDLMRREEKNFPNFFA